MRSSSEYVMLTMVQMSRQTTNYIGGSSAMVSLIEARIGNVF